MLETVQHILGVFAILAIPAGLIVEVGRAVRHDVRTLRRERHVARLRHHQRTF